MKKILLISFLLAFILACGGNAGQVVESEPAPEPEATPSATMGSTQAAEQGSQTASHSPAGLYTLGSMDQSWAVLIERGSDGWTARAMEKEAALPATGKLLADPAGAGMQPFRQFTVDEATGTFTSDWGKGRFETSGANVIMVFEEKPGLFHPETAETDSELYLKKQR